MSQFKKLAVAGGLALLTTTSHMAVMGQPAVPLQTISFKNMLIEKRLKQYDRVEKEGFIRLNNREYPDNKEYYCVVSTIDYYESIERFAGNHWGQWHNRIVLFYGTDDFDSICQITNPTPLSNLKKYAKTRLPRSIITLPGGKQRLTGRTDGYELHFKIVNGREVYCYDNGGYDTRGEDELNNPPPVPELPK